MTRSLKLKLIGAAAVFGLSAAHANGMPQIPTEASIETSADQVGLPSYSAGIVTVHPPCSKCAMRTFYFASDVSLFVNGDPVTPAQLKEALARAGKTPVTVHYRIKDSMISRIVLVTP